MAKIILSEGDLAILSERYPLLCYSVDQNVIKGEIHFDLTYNEVRIKGNYSVEIELESREDSILPIARETNGKILKIAKRKGIPPDDLHLNNNDGELCLIILFKEVDKYPNGFELEKFIKHLEDHFYWISFFNRYDKAPWKDQAHGVDGFVKLYYEDPSCRPRIKKYFESKLGRKFTRPQFREHMKNLKKKIS